VLELSTDNTWLLMENSAGAGATIGRSLDELTTLWARLDRHPHLGLCLDSCHLWVSGVDVTDGAVLDGLVAEVEGTMGLERLRAIHVNDAKTPLGSNLDRHDNIGEGVLGEKLGLFLSHPAFEGLPALLEVPGPDGHGPDANEVKKTKELRERWLSR
jgi:deoxyribonuclease IV